MMAQHAAANATPAHGGADIVRVNASYASAATNAISGPYTAPNNHGSRARAGALQQAHQYTGSHDVPLCGPSPTCNA
jgi:hypothetical protein